MLARPRYVLQRLREIAIGVPEPPAETLTSDEDRAVAAQLKANGTVWVLDLSVCRPLPPKQAHTDGAGPGGSSDSMGEKRAKTLHAKWHIEKIVDETRAGAALTMARAQQRQHFIA